MKVKPSRVLIKYTNGKIESFPCPNEERAKQIAANRKKVVSWQFYPSGARIPKPHKPKQLNVNGMSLEEMEAIIQRM